MRLENRSAFHSTARIRPLVEFVARQTSFSDLALVRVSDTKVPHGKMGGQAWKHRPDVGALSLVAPSLVDVQVGRAALYPYVTRHVDEVGDIKVASWEEEFVLVVAHELFHVDQFWTEAFSSEHAAEVDAERRAKRTLQQYRTHTRRRAPWTAPKQARVAS